MTRKHSSFMAQIGAAKKDASELRKVMGDSARTATLSFPESRSEAPAPSAASAQAESAPSPEGILRKDEAHQLALVARKYGSPAVGREGLMAAMRDAYLLGRAAPATQPTGPQS